MKRFLFAGVLVAAALAITLGSGISYGQGKKVGGGEIKYTQTKGMPPVTFSHAFHVENAKLKCTDCHMKIFKMKTGADKLSMAAFNKGEFCGTCHNGKRAFSTRSACNKCHVRG